MVKIKKGCKKNGNVCPNCNNTHKDTTGNKHPSKKPEVREKISISNTGHKFNGQPCPKCGKVHPDRTGDKNVSRRLEVGKKIRKSKLGKPRSEICKRKISEAKKGKPNPEHSQTLKRLYAEGKIKQWAKGLTKETDERIKRQAEKSLGRKTSKETREKQRKRKLKNPTRYWLGKKRYKNTIEKIKKLWSTKEYRELKRLQRLHQVFPQRDTSIEVKLQEALKSKNIEFQTHYPVLGQPDVVVFNNGSKIAVFCDGCYWHHCNDCGYGKGRDERDITVTQKLTEDGWNVLRFWGHEINDNVEECVDKIFRRYGK